MFWWSFSFFKTILVGTKRREKKFSLTQLWICWRRRFFCEDEKKEKIGRIHHERRVSSNEIHVLTHFHPSCLNNVHPLGRGRTSFKQITSALLDFSFCPLQKYLFQMVTMVAFLRCQFFVLSLDFELRLAYNLIKFRPAIQKYRTSYGLWHKIPKS